MIRGAAEVIGADFDRSDNTNRSYSNFSQTREVPSNTYHTFAGSLHGSIDFFTDQACFLGGLACSLAFSEWEDPEEMRHFQSTVQTSMASTLTVFNNYIANSLGYNPDHPSYQTARSYSKVTMEIGSLTVGVYGVARLGYGVISSGTRTAGSIVMESGCAGQKIAFAAEQYVVRGETALSHGAESINAKVLLNRRLTSQEIASGHAFEKHILNQGEFSGLIRTREQFSSHIENILSNPTDVKQLRNNRIGYWHQDSGTVVIHNPRALDGGTAFQPKNGFIYYQKMLR